MLPRFLPASQLLTAVFCAVLILSFCPMPLAAAEPQGFAAGQTAFARGDYPGAFKIFQSLVRQQPGDPELAFLLGRSAFEIGDFETAIFSFERVLISQPQADRARLELARSFFAIGDLESARSNFQAVLDKKPPAAVQQNIKLFLAQIDKAQQRHSFGGLLSTALVFDSNAHSTPGSEQVQTIFGILPLDGATGEEREDFISQNTLVLNHQYRSHPKATAWNSTLLVHSASYKEETDLNLLLVGLSTGPVWQSERSQTRLQGKINNLQLDNERYLTMGGVSLERNWQVAQRVGMGVSLEASLLDYEADARDGQQYRGELKLTPQLGLGRLSTSLGLEYTTAKDDENAYLRALFALSYQRPLPWRLNLSAGYRFQRTDYDGEAVLFGITQRDVLHELSLGVSRVLWQRADGSQVVAQLSGTHTDNSSNIDLYSYKKQVVNLTFSYLF